MNTGAPSVDDVVWEYDLSSNVVMHEDPKLRAANLRLSYDYDELNRQTRVYTIYDSGIPDGTIDIRYDFDDYNGMNIDWSTMVDVDGNPINQNNIDNAKGRLTRVRSTGNDQIKIFFYSKRGEILQQNISIDEREYVIRYKFDEAGQLIAKTMDPSQPASSTNQITYDYNDRGLLENINAQSGLVSANYIYTVDGGIDEMSRGNGAVTTYYYDRLARLENFVTTPTTINFNRTFTLDNMGNLKEVWDGGGTPIGTYQYDNLHRLDLASFTTSSGFPPSTQVTRDYEYDKVGNLLTMNGNPSDYSYLAGTNRVTSVVSGSNTYTYEYDDNGNIITKDPNSIATTFKFEFDYLNRMNFTQNDVAGEAYVYGEDWRRIMKRETILGSVDCGKFTDYVYEGNSVVYEGYTYKRLRNGEFEAHTDAGEPVHFTGWTEGVGNDPNNIQIDMGENGDGVKITYTPPPDENDPYWPPGWEDAPEITQFKIPVFHDSSYTLQVRYKTTDNNSAYIALGRWDTGNHNDITLPSTGGTWQSASITWTAGPDEFWCMAFLGVHYDVSGTVWYDNVTLVPCRGGFGSPLEKSIIVYANDQPLAILLKHFESPSFSVSYIHSDHIGSVSLLTNILGQESGRCEYEPFGMELARFDMDNFLYRFTGKELDGINGLYYFGARFYDPEIGRWMGIDPVLSDHFSPYSYVYDNPMYYVDPNGEFAWLPIAIGAAIGGTIGGYHAHIQDQNILEGIGIGMGLGAIAGGGLAIAGSAVSFGYAGGPGFVVEVSLAKTIGGLALSGAAVTTGIGVMSGAPTDDLWKYALSGATIGATVGFGTPSLYGGLTFTESMILNALINANVAPIVSIKHDLDFAETIGLTVALAGLGAYQGAIGFGIAHAPYAPIPQAAMAAHYVYDTKRRGYFKGGISGLAHHGVLGLAMMGVGAGGLDWSILELGPMIFVDDVFEHAIINEITGHRWSPMLQHWFYLGEIAP
jgi:RHS repeat-associated protein